MDSGDRSISAILMDVVRNFQEIVRSEVRLAKAEVREEAGKLRTGAVLVATGAMLGVFGLLFLLLAAFCGLSTVMPDWQAALAVAGGLVIVSGVLAGFGIRQLNRVRAPPERTIKNIKENIRWARGPTK